MTAETKPGDQADLLEAAETIAFRQNPGVDFERDAARQIIKQVYAIASWTEEYRG